MKKAAWLLVRLSLGLGAAGAWVTACSGVGGSAPSGETPAGSGGDSGSGGDGSGGSGQGNNGGVSGSGNAAGGAGGQGGAPAGSGGAAAGGSGGDPFGGAAGTINLPDGGKDAIDEACAGVEAKANRIPLTIYIVIDRSSSLGTKWDDAKKGLDAFLNDPASAGISVGLVTFPKQNLVNGECNFGNYTTPEVDFAQLPGNAKPTLDFLATVQPNGKGTPLYPALGGAHERGLQFKKDKPNENFVVLLVTDGEPAPEPSKCNGVDALSIDTINGLASTVLSKYGLKTYVIGLPGIPKTFADGLAKSGGTEAIVIQQGLDLGQQFQKALSAVQGEGLGCEFPLPPDSTKYDKTLVNVKYTKGDGSGALDLERSPGCIAGKGWDYDNDQTPTKVLLCGATCGDVKKDGLAKIDVVLGCPTRLIQ